MCEIGVFLGSVQNSRSPTRPNGRPLGVSHTLGSYVLSSQTRGCGQGRSFTNLSGPNVRCGPLFGPSQHGTQKMCVELSTVLHALEHFRFGSLHTTSSLLWAIGALAARFHSHLCWTLIRTFTRARVVFRVLWNRSRTVAASWPNFSPVEWVVRFASTEVLLAPQPYGVHTSKAPRTSKPAGRLVWTVCTWLRNTPKRSRVSSTGARKGSRKHEAMYT